MATPPKHERALILRHIRKSLGETCLADSGFPGYQDHLPSTGKHLVKRCPKCIQFARPTDDRSTPNSALNWQIAHTELILQMILDAALHQGFPAAQGKWGVFMQRPPCIAFIQGTPQRYERVGADVGSHPKAIFRLIPRIVVRR
jgi:hypothetical protein